MEPNLITLEPERANSLLRWWSEPEAAALLDCLDKAHKVALVQALALQANSKSDNKNPNFEAAAVEKLNEAAEFETAIKVLKSFFPDGPFIARIEL